MVNGRNSKNLQKRLDPAAVITVLSGHLDVLTVLAMTHNHCFTSFSPWWWRGTFCPHKASYIVGVSQLFFFFLECTDLIQPDGGKKYNLLASSLASRPLWAHLAFTVGWERS